MKFILSVLMLLASVLASVGAVNYPARTNGNNTFYGDMNVTGQFAVSNNVIIHSNVTFTPGATSLANITDGVFGQGSSSAGAVRIGNQAGRYAGTGGNRVLVGLGAGNVATNALNLVAIGHSAGRYVNEADYSIFFGKDSGINATNSSMCVFIGYASGQNENSLTNKLIIDSRFGTAGTNGLIYGEFDNRLLRVNGRLEATNGFLLRSNLVSTIPTLSPGDNFYWSSNGVPHVIWQDQAGTQATNRLVP